MSNLRATVESVRDVVPHPNADRLDVVTVLGWQLVTQRGAYQPGDLAVYLPIDSVLPPDLEAVLFPPDAKIKLDKSRIKTVRIRGVVSQGMLASAAALGDKLPASSWREGTDVTAILGVTKYAPPVKVQLRPARQVSKASLNPHFAKYTDLQHLKNYPNLLDEGEEVVVTEKIHGTSFRAGWVPRVARTWWHRLRERLGLWWDPWEFVYGSRNVQLTPGSGTYYSIDVYAKAVRDYNLRDRLPLGVVVYGEIYGHGVQPGYSYGCAAGETKLAVYDVAVSGKYLDYARARPVAENAGLRWVPLLRIGRYSKELVAQLTTGPSVLCPEQSVREGCVVRPYGERSGPYGRVVAKSINPDYLLSKHAGEEVAEPSVAA